MKKKTNSITTVVSFILDESGSMESIRDSVITGFNEYVQGLQSQKGAILFSLTKFDSNHIDMPYRMESIGKIAPLDHITYRPGGSTPLYDAVVETIESLAQQTNSKQAIIVAIMTDGYENTSRKHDQKCLAELIKKLQQQGNWTFVFMGANQDSWALAQNIGIPIGNTMDWQATDRGTATAFLAMASSTMDMNNALAKDPSILRSANFFGANVAAKPSDAKEVEKK